MTSRRLSDAGLPRPNVDLAPQALDVFLRTPDVGPIDGDLCLGQEGSAGPGPEWAVIGHRAGHFLVAGAPGPQDQASGEVQEMAGRPRRYRRRQERNLGPGQIGAGVAGGGSRPVEDAGDLRAVADEIKGVKVHVDRGGRGEPHRKRVGGEIGVLVATAIHPVIRRRGNKFVGRGHGVHLGLGPSEQAAEAPQRPGLLLDEGQDEDAHYYSIRLSLNFRNRL